MSGISAFLQQGGKKPDYVSSRSSSGGEKTSSNDYTSSTRSGGRGGGNNRGVSFGGSYIRHISESDRPMRRKDTYSKNKGNQQQQRDRNYQHHDNKRDFGRGSSYRRENEFGSRVLFEEKDEKAKAEEEALALKLAEQDDSLQAIGSEFFIPIEQEYDMFLKKLVNWKNDSHSISRKTNDGEQLKQFREYDDEASKQTKDLMLQIFKSNCQNHTPKSICATTNKELTSTFRDSVSEIQEDVGRGKNKNYGLLDKTILHYEDIMYSLWKAPLLTDRKSERDTEEENLNDDNFEKFHEELERENNEKRDIDNFSQLADELFEKCTDLFKMAEQTPLFDVTQDDKMQQVIQSIVETSKKSVYKNSEGPHDAGHLFFAVSDLLGRGKDDPSSADKINTTTSEYSSGTGAGSSAPKRSRATYESDDENTTTNNDEDATVKKIVKQATTNFELLGDRFRLLPEVHKYENYLKRSMGVSGLDYTGKTSLNNRKKQIRLDSSVALRHDWMDKEPKEIAKLATPHTQLSKTILSLNSKCTQVVDSLLY